MANNEIQQVVLKLEHEECNTTINGDVQQKLADMEGSAFEKITGFKAFTFQELVSATDNFSPSNMLGEGSNGQVFRGLLGGKHVAVKRLLQHECVEEEDKEVFIREIGHLAAVNHQNILSLVGFCLDAPTPLLVTEKLHSLQKALYEDENHLNWTTRFRIALGVAKGLEYLHTGARRPMVHCDIKPGNILLDPENLTRSYIADFGVVHLLAGHQSVESGEELEVSWYYGTFGYWAPEARAEKRLSTKSDVYSFGKLLYALVSGKENVHDMPASLIRKSELPRGVRVYHKVCATLRSLCLPRNNIIETTVDPALVEEVWGSARALIEASTVLKLIVLCTQNNAEQRPSMDSVRVELESATSCQISWPVKTAISVGIKTCRWLSYLAMVLSISSLLVLEQTFSDWLSVFFPPLTLLKVVGITAIYMCLKIVNLMYWSADEIFYF